MFFKIGLVLFFLMLFAPTQFQAVKLPLLIIVLLAVLYRIIKNRKMMIHKEIFILLLFYISVGLSFSLLGLLNSAPGAIKVMTSYIIWPVVYILFISAIDDIEKLDKLYVTMYIATIAIMLYILYFTSYYAGLIPEHLYIEIFDDKRQGISFSGDGMEISVFSLSSLLFLIPFWITYLYIWPKKQISRYIKKKNLIILVIFGCLIVLISGRRGLLFVVAIAPMFIMFFDFFNSNTTLSKKIMNSISFIFLATFIASLILIYITFYYGFDIISAYDNFMTGFYFSDDDSASSRSKQFFALLEKWFDRPILGYGHGAANYAYLRSSDQPWAYELSYIALLFQTGIVGIISYSIGILWIFWRGIYILKSNSQLGVYMLPLLVGMSCFLVANATNPYLLKFDFIWVLFLPISIINLHLLKQKDKLFIKEGEFAKLK